jgi:hypothetical protein
MSSLPVGDDWCSRPMFELRFDVALRFVRCLGEVVDALRQREVSWAKIAEPLGVSRQTAWERFG